MKPEIRKALQILRQATDALQVNGVQHRLIEESYRAIEQELTPKVEKKEV